jgi:hypothetical protein
MKFRLGYPDGLDELREALQLMPAEPPSVARAQMLAGCARRMDIAKDPGALAMAEEALAVARQTGDAATEAYTMLIAAVAADPQGQIPGRWRYCGEHATSPSRYRLTVRSFRPSSPSLTCCTGWASTSGRHR